jgi:hypothetical protein
MLGGVPSGKADFATMRGRFATTRGYRDDSTLGHACRVAATGELERDLKTSTTTQWSAVHYTKRHAAAI